ncbi:unnamed protein product, partial [Owenia fusiformis]
KMDAEEDPVVHEVNVYLSKSLADNLYLLQYPVRPSSMTYDDVTTLAARMKPEQQKIELELRVNTASANYSKSKGEQIALNVDGAQDYGGGDAPDRFYKSDKMDKQVLTSSRVHLPSARYAAGILKDGELHLTSVHGVVQMRPSFGYMDKADTKIKEDIKAQEAGESSQDEEEEAKPIHVKFSRVESEEAKARRKASYGYLLKQQDEEPWVKMNFHSQHADLSQAVHQQLTSNVSQPVSELHSTPNEFLEKLIEKPSESNSEKPALPTNVISLTQLRNMPVSDQIRSLLINAKVIKFSTLMQLLPKNTDVTAALRPLQQVAMLVQGCWVVKSDVLYPKDTCSPHSGASSDILCRSRDYVMWKFTQSRHVIRKEITSVIKLSTEDVRAILEQMSKVKAHHGWEFIQETDNTFLSRHPEVAQRQTMLWEAKYQQLCKQLKLTAVKEEKKDGGMSPPERPKRRRTTSKSRRSFSDHSDTDSDAPKTEVKNENIDTSRLSGGTAVANGPVRARRRSSSDQDKDKRKKELHLFINEKISEMGVVTFSELKRQFQLKLASCPPGHVLGTGVSDRMLQQAVLDCGGERLKSEWPPKVTKEELFIFYKPGDSTYVQTRQRMLEMFHLDSKIRLHVLQQLLNDKEGLTLTAPEIKNIVKDYCVPGKNGLWYLKGTQPTDNS